MQQWMHVLEGAQPLVQTWSDLLVPLYCLCSRLLAFLPAAALA